MHIRMSLLLEFACFGSNKIILLILLQNEKEYRDQIESGINVKEHCTPGRTQYVRTVVTILASKSRTHGF